MDSVDFLKRFRRTLPPTEAKQIISCLRQEPLVWSSLQDSSFCDEVFKNIGSRLELWNPGALALLAVDNKQNTIEVINQPSLPIDPGICQNAIHIYEETLITNKPPTSLKQAGLLALALRERRRLKGSWQGLGEEIRVKDPNLSTFAVWKTPLACVYTFCADPLEYLKSLVGHNTQDIQDFHLLTIHVLYTNPLTDNHRKVLFTKLLDQCSTQDRITWLELLENFGQVALVKDLARTYTDAAQTVTFLKEMEAGVKTVDPLTDRAVLQKIDELHQLASLFRSSGFDELAVSCLAKACEFTGILQAQFTLRLADLAQHNQDDITTLHALEQVNDLVPQSGIARSCLANHLIETNRSQEAARFLVVSGNGLYSQLTSARIAYENGDLSLAKNLINEVGQNPLFSALDNLVNASFFARIGKDLLDHHLADQAAILVNIGLEHFPVDTSLLDLSTKIGLTMGESPNAIQTGYLSVLLEPENNDLKKHLACILEQSGDWTTAFDERKQIIAQSSAPATDDLLHLANCSIKINKPQIANSICKGILANDPENTEANLYLGEALINQNDFDEGIVYLKQACLISPENFATWLKLAQAFQTFHKDDIALETLKEAVNVIPDSAEIRQALSILLLQHGTLSEALPHLKAAYDLNPLMLQTVLLLGQTLTKLGHVEEANKILEDSRVSYPNNKELALLHGQILVQLGRHTEAWPLLQTGLEIASDNIDALIAYGKSVLSLSKNEPEISEASGENPIPLPDINKAILALNTAVNINPTNIEARLILNELLFAHQEFQKALDGFMQISKLGESKNSEWNWQILLGEGKSALKLGLVDRALISLREAAAVKPDHIQIQQQLADAYFQADLRSEANELAQTVLYLAPQDLGVLIWYSSIKARLGQYPSAVASLEKAIQLSPDRLDLLVRLAENEHRSGHDELVQKALEQVLANPLANTEILRQSANLYTDIGDLPSAIAYLEKARDLTTSPSVDLLCELVRAYEANQNILAALSTINYLLDGNANDLPLLEMKMRLLIKANQLDEALECAKNALTQFETNCAQGEGGTVLPVPTDRTIALDLYRLACYLLHSVGESQLALEMVTKGLVHFPDDLVLCTHQAELTFTLMLRNNQEQPWAVLLENNSQSAEMQPSLTNLLCVLAEDALELNNFDLVNAILAKATVIAPEHPRVLSAQSRLSCAHNDFTSALQKLESAISAYIQSTPSSSQSSGIVLEEKLNTYWSPLAIAEAAFDLHQWQAALDYYLKAAEVSTRDPRPHFRQARALTLCAEMQKKCQLLRITRHAPGSDLLSGTYYNICSEAIKKASVLGDIHEINRWNQRAECVFNPTQESASDLLNHLIDASDASAAYSASCATGDADSSARIFSDYHDSPAVQLEAALAALNDQPALCSSMAQELIKTLPNDPMCLALAAFSNQNNDLEACQLIEKALALWPDEIQWHEFAAEKYRLIGDLSRSIAHWQEANQLEPENLKFLMELAQSCNEIGEINLVIQYYEQAVQLDPNLSEARLLLAKAYQTAGNLTAALTCAEKAASLTEDKIPPLLLGGQVALELNQKEMAHQKAQGILEINPDHMGGIILFTQVREAMGYPAEALAFIEQSMQRIQPSYHCLAQRAHLVHRVYGSVQALPHYLDLAHDYPDQTEILNPYAEILIETGHLDEGEAIAHESLQLDPNQPILHLLLGRLQRYKGQLDQAIYHLCETIKLSPNEINAYLELGHTYHDKRDHGLAIKTYRQATRIAPNDPRPYYHASLALKECKDYVGAETMLRYAAQLAPDDLNIRRQLAVIITLNLVHNPHEVTLRQ